MAPDNAHCLLRFEAVWKQLLVSLLLPTFSCFQFFTSQFLLLISSHPHQPTGISPPALSGRIILTKRTSTNLNLRIFAHHHPKAFCPIAKHNNCRRGGHCEFSLSAGVLPPHTGGQPAKSNRSSDGRLSSSRVSIAAAGLSQAQPCGNCQPAHQIISFSSSGVPFDQTMQPNSLKCCLLCCDYFSKLRQNQTEEILQKNSG